MICYLNVYRCVCVCVFVCLFFTRRHFLNHNKFLLNLMPYDDNCHSNSKYVWMNGMDGMDGWM